MAGHLSNSEICPIFYMWVLWKKKKLHMNNITDDKKNLNKRKPGWNGFSKKKKKTSYLKAILLYLITII